MDSDDEARDSAASGSHAGQADGDGHGLPTSVSGVRLFSEMLRMAPSLQDRAAQLPDGELAAVCDASARVGFYDSMLFAAVTQQLRRRLRRTSNTFSAQDLVAIVGGLAELNAYDREVFSEVARALGGPGLVSSLTTEQRKRLLASFKSAKHDGNHEFIEALAQQYGSDKYEAAKSELLKRNLTKMYGETFELQGPSEDAERAQLKKRRPQTTRER